MRGHYVRVTHMHHCVQYIHTTGGGGVQAAKAACNIHCIRRCLIRYITHRDGNVMCSVSPIEMGMLCVLYHL